MGRCDAILQNGIFDTLVVDASRTTGENLYNWLRSLDWSQFKSRQDSGGALGLPIKGVPLEIKATHTEDEFNEWKKQVDTGGTREFTETEAMKIIQRNVRASSMHGSPALGRFKQGCTGTWRSPQVPQWPSSPPATPPTPLTTTRRRFSPTDSRLLGPLPTTPSPRGMRFPTAG